MDEAFICGSARLQREISSIKDDGTFQAKLMDARITKQVELNDTLEWLPFNSRLMLRLDRFVKEVKSKIRNEARGWAFTG